MLNLKRNDLVMHETGVIATVLKTYETLDTKEQYIQALADSKLLYGRVDQFKPMDCLLLRCNNCQHEAYEIELNVKEDTNLYVCDCGSSTFTPLNMEELNLI